MAGFTSPLGKLKLQPCQENSFYLSSLTFHLSFQYSFAVATLGILALPSIQKNLPFLISDGEDLPSPLSIPDEAFV